MTQLHIVNTPRKPQPQLEDDGNWGCVLCSTRKNWYNSARDDSQVARADQAQGIMDGLDRKFASYHTRNIKFVPLTRQQAIGLDKSWKRVGAMTVGGVGESAEIITGYLQKVIDNPAESQKYLNFAKNGLGRQDGFFSNLGDKLDTDRAHWEYDNR